MLGLTMRVRKRKDRHSEYYGMTDDHKVRYLLCGEIVNMASQNVYETGERTYHTKCLFDSYQRITRRSKEDGK